MCVCVWLNSSNNKPILFNPRVQSCKTVSFSLKFGHKNESNQGLPGLFCPSTFSKGRMLAEALPSFDRLSRDDSGILYATELRSRQW